VYQAQNIMAGLDWITVLVTGIDSTRQAWIVDAAGTSMEFRRRCLTRPGSV
jgi:hypothetical protein